MVNLHMPNVTLSDRRSWIDKLISSDVHAVCSHRECQYWDKFYNTSRNVKLNIQRQEDQSNYLLWAKKFCNSIGPEELSSLHSLERDNGCMPCIGRMLYLALKLEYISIYFVRQDKFTALRKASTFPGNLQKPHSRMHKWRRNAIRNAMAESICMSIVDQCGKPHFEELSCLLNLGAHINITLRGGVFGLCKFPILGHDETITSSSLRMRVKRSNRLKLFTLLFVDLSISQIWDFIHYLRSEDIVIQAH